MSEIEKMYVNIGIGKKLMCEWICKDSPYCNVNCKHYGSTQLYYPPFTPEKQLSLIKWLAKKDCIYRLTYERDFLWCSQTEWQSSFCYESFEESLANLINTLWQDLIEQEKTEIAEILKG